MPSPPPFIIRLYLPSDFNAVLAIVQAAAQADGLPQRQTADALRARLRIASSDPRLSPADDLWVVSVRATGVVAFADGWLTGEGGQRGYRTDCFVHPDYRGRGVGRALLTRQCQRAQAIARKLATAATPVTVMLGARAWERQAAAVAVLEAKGVPRVRTYLELTRDLSQPVTARPAPPGLRLEPWLDRRADDVIWQAFDEAFSDHWGYTGESFESFMRRMTLGHIQGEHSLVARAGSTVAGASLNNIDAAAAGRAPAGRPAWIRQLFVRRAWRGRGLGRALVAGSLIHARQLGYARAGLIVDEENTTGALKLYPAAGFVEAARRYAYQLLLSS
jgi:mycothiol synthase